MRKVISFGLWTGERGKRDAYLKGALINLELAREIYPDWEVWFYVGETTVPEEVTGELRRGGATVITWDDRVHPWWGLFVRFLPAADPSIDYYVVKDCDSSLNWRGKAAHDEWIRSGHTWHVMRDAKPHSVQMVGDMWGCKGGAVPNLEERMRKWLEVNPQWFRFGGDQKFLATEIWPDARKDAIIHDSERWRSDEPRWRHIYGESKPFPDHDCIWPCRFVGETRVTDLHVRRRSLGKPVDENHMHGRLAGMSEHDIVEIGVLYGKTSGILAENSKQAVFGIDPIVPDSMNDKLIGEPDKIRLLEKRYANYTWIKGYSYDVVKDWSRSIGYLFLDGDHQYSAVKRDFEDWVDHVVAGGHISIHDSAAKRGGPHHWPGPTQLALELMEDKRVEYVDTVYSLTVFRKR